MRTNMKLKSTLWALAFAVAAVSCSDDLEGTGGNGNGSGEGMDGQTAFVKVAINTNIGTKASSVGPDGGEGEGTELGYENEYKVNDVTIVLFNNLEGETPSTTDFDFKGTSNICGVGFATVGDQGSSNLEQHEWQATVEVVMDDEQSSSLIGNKYGVIAVTNLGGTKESTNALYKDVKGGTIKTGEDLADYLQNTAWTESSGAFSDFIMSTHTMQWPAGTGAQSVVEIEPNVTADEAPLVNVYVERLAAKIRIREADDITNFIYTLKASDEADAEEIAKVRLDQVAIVNQQNAATYLLKRVSENNPEIFSDQMSVTYLGNEVWTDSEKNYVMDPWIVNRNENATLPASPKQLSYLNPYRQTGTEDANMLSFSAQWKDYADETSFNEKVKNLATADEADFNDNDAIRLAYTQENVTQSKHSFNGYSTGALFKATYLPKQMIDVKTTGEGAGIETEPTKVASFGGDAYDNIDKETTGVDFYAYNGEIYADQEAVFVAALNNGLTADAKKEGLSYAKFTEAKFSSMKISEYKAYFANIMEPFDYIDDLNTKVAAYEATKGDEGLTDDDTMSDLTGAKVFTDFVEEKKNYGNVIYYKNGECYYPYWIRHANNNNNALMGVMEFAIVRNNIYELQVAGMDGLGFSGTENVPDPENPDEDSSAKIRVVLYVKNWVVRSNSGIIL